MTVLPSNMFNTVVLPAMLWFFDKAKPLTEKKDEVLFVDARKIYTQVDATHRKFTEEQQRCLALITRLYESDAGEYAALENWLAGRRDAAKAEKAKRLAEEEAAFAAAQGGGKTRSGRGGRGGLAAATKRHEKAVAEITRAGDAEIARLEGHLNWLKESFPEGRYRDVTGLCKVAKIEGEGGIAANGWSLNPGRYVGVMQEIDTTTPEQFRAEMKALHAEFAALTAAARELESRIAANLKGALG